MPPKRKRANNTPDTTNTTTRNDHTNMGPRHSSESSPSRRKKTTLPVTNNSTSNVSTANTNSTKRSAKSRQPKTEVKTEDTSKFSSERCSKWFDNYKDGIEDGEEVIGFGGSGKFIQDLGLPEDSHLILVLAYKLGTASIGIFTKTEWMEGMTKLDTDTVSKLKSKFPEFEKIYQDPAQFKEIYKYTFGFAKNKGKKNLEVVTAIGMWQWLLANKFPHVTTFIQFLNEKQPVKVINKDQWMNFFEFCSTVSQDLKNYDEASAWPVLMDEYVEWIRGKQPENGGGDN